MNDTQSSLQRTAVCEVDISKLVHDLTGFENYSRVFTVFRLEGEVVGRAWIPLSGGAVSAATLRSYIPKFAWEIWQQKIKQLRIPASGPVRKASIIVCTRDRTDDLKQCLPRLLPFIEQGHELIVVDNCPGDDQTRQLVASYPSIRYEVEPRPGLGFARNCGLSAATAEFIVFTDDDAQVDSGWLEALLRNFEDPMVALVTGVTMPVELETEAQLWFEITNGFARGFSRREFDATNLNPLGAGMLGAGANCAFRKSVFKEVGLFNEMLGPGTLCCSGDDHEFYYRVLSHGYRAIYEPGALVWHKHRRNWDSLRRTLFGYGVGVFAWWTHALLIEKEIAVLWWAPNYFFGHHIPNLARALLRRPGHIPLDLAWAEFSGALVAPLRYFRSRRKVHKQARGESAEKNFQPGIQTASAAPPDPGGVPAVRAEAEVP